MTESVRLLSVTEITNNLRAGFNQFWDVDRAYEFGRSKSPKYKGVEILRAVDGAGIRRLYAPAIEPDLVEEFAQVNNLDDDTPARDKLVRDKLKAFVERFGLLGFQNISPLKPGPGGDPVKWALARAREVHDALEIQSLLEEMQKTGRDTKLRRELPRLTHETKLFLGSPTKNSSWRASDVEEETIRFVVDWPNDPARTAWQCLEHIINPLLRRIRFKILPGDAVSLPNLTLQFDALIDVIAWRLATQLKRLKPYICESCGRLGFSRRTSKKTCSQKCRKQKYLSKPLTSGQSRKRSPRKRRK